jgi:probable HAF family extracellular repeat protein
MFLFHSVGSSYTFIRSTFLLIAVSIVTMLAGSAGAQAQASCQFVKFNRRLVLNAGHRYLNPEGITDNGTVVGDAYDDADFTVRAFTRLPDGSIIYYKRNNPETYFLDRSNTGVTVGVTGPAFSLASTTGTPFLLKGSTFTPITTTIGGTTYKKFTVRSINKWGTTVGAFTDSTGKVRGFKRSSDGKAVALNFPGAAQTDAFAINDNGTIVGYYSKTASPNLFRHGFIYNNGQFAKLDFPSTTLQTELTGISDSNLIIGTTIKGSNATSSFLYKNGTFKKIVMPSSNVPTYADSVSPSQSLITGFSGYTGFIATCK